MAALLCSASNPHFTLDRLLNCAENRDFISDGCVELKVCVKRNTTQYTALLGLYPAERLLVLGAEALTVVESFGNGACLVYASGVVERTAKAIKTFLPEGEAYFVGTVPFTRESLALVTKEDDVVFSKLVDAVVNAIIYADEKGITQANPVNMPRVNLFKPLIANEAMFRNVIRAVGNYQEIWDRHTNPEGGLLRGGRNLPNTLPLGPTLMTVLTWNKLAPIPPNR